jgi:hypothetical protein
MGQKMPYTNAELFEMFDNGDVFNIARITLRGQLDKAFAAWKRVAEAWTPQRKEEIIQKMRQRKLELRDHAQIGDYDIALWTGAEIDREFFGVASANFVSLNVGQHDPGDAAVQMADTESGSIPIKAIAKKLAEWAQRHGKLAVSSYVPDRTAKYYRWVIRLIPNCRVSWIRPDQPEYGFYVEP